MLLIATVLIAILFIVVSSTVFKLHPLLALLLAAFGVGLAAGMPPAQIADTIGKGFGELMTKIGLMVILGCIIGAILDRSGAALTVADTILRVFGNKQPALAMSVIGAIVGIPVFCDSGYIILARLAQVVAERTKTAVATTSLALAGGLFATHTLVPPTPGPVSAAGNLGITESLGLVIGIGLVVSLPNVLLSQWFGRRFGAAIVVQQESHLKPVPKIEQPSTGLAFSPIAIPILLITLASIVKTLFPEATTGVVAAFITLGNPLVALLLAVFWSYLLFPHNRAEQLLTCVREGVAHCGPTLVLVGAGGAFGAVLKATPLTALVSGWLQQSQVSGLGFLVLAFGISAFFKTAQGSTTSAMVLTTSMLAPLLTAVGFTQPLDVTLVVMAVGSGAMVVSHSNDAYFWVVSQFSGIAPADAYRSLTVLTALQGLVSLLTTLLLYVIFG
ncbi:GntP family permease [Spirosoma knui]